VDEKLAETRGRLKMDQLSEPSPDRDSEVNRDD